jgi:hypothetical protein
MPGKTLRSRPLANFADGAASGHEGCDVVGRQGLERCSITKVSFGSGDQACLVPAQSVYKPAAQLPSVIDRRCRLASSGVLHQLQCSIQSYCRRLYHIRCLAHSYLHSARLIVGPTLPESHRSIHGDGRDRGTDLLGGPASQKVTSRDVFF